MFFESALWQVEEEVPRFRFREAARCLFSGPDRQSVLYMYLTQMAGRTPPVERSLTENLSRQTSLNSFPLTTLWKHT